MRRIKTPKDGEYVLLTKYPDRDIKDPYFLGYYAGYQIVNGKKVHYGTYEDGTLCYRCFNYCFRIKELSGVEAYICSVNRGEE